MKTPILPPTTLIKDTGTEKGRGVFADRDYREGELIEEAPVVVLYEPFNELPAPLKTIVFNWGNLAQTKTCSAVALGFGSLYNHNNPANMRFAADSDRETLQYIAARDILVGEELTINYNSASGGPESDEDDWFKRNNITPITH